MTTPTGAAPEQRKHSHYHKDIRHLETLDIYRVCDLFITNDPSGALAHAAKKILVAGGRGAKDIREDIQESIDTLQRKLEMLDEDQRAGGCVVAGYDPGAGNDATVVAQFDERGLVDARKQDAQSSPFSVDANVAIMTRNGKPVIGGITLLKDSAILLGEFMKRPFSEGPTAQIYEAARAAMADTPIQPEDPHAELRKTWKPGQQWQVKRELAKVWDDLHATEPAWIPTRRYRRHPEDIDPWYPDNSGAWVEVPSHLRIMPAGLNQDDQVRFLFASEREHKRYTKANRRAGDIKWDRSPQDGLRVVAYMTERKADEKPWYPDESGAWVEVNSETRSMPKQLSGLTLVEILTKKERSSRKYARVIKAAGEVIWDNNEGSDCRVVAYKIIF